MWAIGLLLAALFLWIHHRKRSFRVLKELGIPGPEPNIIFGNILELIQKTPIKCHEEWINRYGKIVGYYFGSQPVVLIADVDILKRIQVSEFHKFINRPNIARINNPKDKRQPPRVEGFSQHLVSLRDKRWKEIRSIITPSFTASKMKTMVPIMNGAIDSLMANIEKKSGSGDAFDIYSMYQGLTMDVIGRTAFGIHTDVQNDPNDPFLRSAKAVFAGDISNPIVVLAVSFRRLQSFWSWLGRLRLRYLNKGVNPIKDLIQSVKSVIATRRRNPENRRPDLLQLMIDAEVSDSKISSDDLIAKGDSDVTEKQEIKTVPGKLTRKMTDADILDNSVLFFLAGYETTSTALAFTTHFLLQYPEVQEKMREEVMGVLRSEGELSYACLTKLPYMDQVLNESLRLYPPIYLFVNRECAEDIDFGSFRLKAGMAVQTSTYTIQRDPQLWDNPTEFHPERFAAENKGSVHPMAFQAFGNGPRNCVGMRFAQMEAKLALARILSKYNFQACPQTEKDPITLKISAATMNPRNGIWLKAVTLET